MPILWMVHCIMGYQNADYKSFLLFFFFFFSQVLLLVPCSTVESMLLILTGGAWSMSESLRIWMFIFGRHSGISLKANLWQSV